MRGVVFTGNRSLEIASFDDPTPGPNDAVVAIKASGMCGSDLRFYRLSPQEALAAYGTAPESLGDKIIGGHEPCGVVVELGEKVDSKSVKVGDRVMVYHYGGCGFCDSCRSGWSQMCDQGATIYGATTNGGHADFMAVPADRLIPLPDGLSFSAGAAISCGIGTAFQALVRLNLSARDTLAVFGQGPVGQSAVLFGTAMGAHVIAVDIEPSRVARATDFGAVHSLNSGDVDPVEAILELTDGKGVSCAVDASGAAVARAAAVRSAAKWGRVAFVGEGGEVTLNVSHDILRKQLTILGSWTFSIAGQAECARFSASHGVDIDKVFTDRWSLAEAAEAYREFDKQSGGKAVFEL